MDWSCRLQSSASLIKNSRKIHLKVFFLWSIWMYPCQKLISNSVIKKEKLKLNQPTICSHKPKNHNPKFWKSLLKFQLKTGWTKLVANAHLVHPLMSYKLTFGASLWRMRMIIRWCLHGCMVVELFAHFVRYFSFHLVSDIVL